MRALLFAIEIRTNGAASGEFVDARRLPLYFRKCRARGHAQLLSEDVEDAREADERRVFGNGAGRKFTEV